MGENLPITASVDAETLALVDRLALARGISRAEFATEAIRRAAEEDADFWTFVQIGIDAADRGELIPQDQVFADLKRRRAQRAAG